MSVLTPTEEARRQALPPMRRREVRRASVDDLLAAIYADAGLLDRPEPAPCPVVSAPAPVAVVSDVTRPMVRSRPSAAPVRTQFSRPRRPRDFVILIGFVLLMAVLGSLAHVFTQPSVGPAIVPTAPVEQSVGSNQTPAPLVTGPVSPAAPVTSVDAGTAATAPVAVATPVANAAASPASVSLPAPSGGTAPAPNAANVPAEVSAVDGGTGTVPPPAATQLPVAQNPTPTPPQAQPPAASAPKADPPVVQPPASQPPAHPAPANNAPSGPAMQAPVSSDAAHGEVGHNGATPAVDPVNLHLDDNAPVVVSFG